MKGLAAEASEAAYALHLGALAGTGVPSLLVMQIQADQTVLSAVGHKLRFLHTHNRQAA